NRERRRIDDASRLPANLDDLPRGGRRRIDAIDRVPAPIEHEVLPRRGLLEAAGIAEPARDVWGDRFDGAQDVGLEGRRAAYENRQAPERTNDVPRAQPHRFR